MLGKSAAEVFQEDPLHVNAGFLVSPREDASGGVAVHRLLQILPLNDEGWQRICLTQPSK
ncbi:hypothetical protein RISK_002802 [Rhodopirellula islandica]|uniref:Uncharacterized protein n=1 Tax=Rhodopirellula islandica TaxID=595434 RepID=A0A0J1BET9_RHOIS|nr:hypothetical protein RISK_002802 [Rhodopirellula islandica]